MSDALTKWDERFLALADLVATWSKDPGSKVGCCIIDGKRRVVSVGFNGSPRGVEDATDRPRKLMRTVHAEANALHFANRDVVACVVYVTHPPCANCAAHLIQRGISEVVFRRPSPEFLERWGDNYYEGLSMFGEAGVRVREVA